MVERTIIDQSDSEKALSMLAGSRMCFMRMLHIPTALQSKVLA
jgi:hypothetical protein